ncbi:MAG: lipoate-protein ligase A [Psychromonas sp.]|uniref:lipoate protein ligase C-terminal domain-containing protein n=1 Tax=Psychromonas sp. TaxID=1884585 RepID=UPI0039E4B371
MEHISPDQLPDLPDFPDKFALQKSWEWNYGKTPQFTYSLAERFEWGGVELHFNVENAHISDIKIFTDSLDPAPLERLSEQLQGVPYQPKDVQTCIEQVIIEFPANTKELIGVQQWLIQAIV